PPRCTLFPYTTLFRSMFRPEDYETKSHVVLLSYGLWQRRFASNRDVVGKTVDFGGVPYTVAGVLPRDFKFRDADLIVPMVVEGKDRESKRLNSSHLPT